jgi:hypothetical protein
MKILAATLAFLLLTSSLVLVSSAQTQLNLEWQKKSGFDLPTGINGEWTITAHPAGNTTAYVEFYLDGQLVLKDAKAPYSWTFSTDSYPEGEHTIRVDTYTSTGAISSASEQRSFTDFPYILIVGVLLFGSIVFAFALLLTWYLIKQKANARRTVGKTNSITNEPNKR